MQVEGDIFVALRQAEAAGVMPLGQAGVSEEVRGAMNSIHEAMAGLPPESPLRAQLDDMLSGLQSGTIAPNNVATAIANVMQAVQGAGSGSVGASSAAAFKASMINSVSGASEWAAESAYEVLSENEFFMGLDEQGQQRIMQESAELMDAYKTEDDDKIKAQEAKLFKRALAEGATEDQARDLVYELREEARENGIEISEAVEKGDHLAIGTAGGKQLDVQAEFVEKARDAGYDETEVAVGVLEGAKEFINASNEGLVSLQASRGAEASASRLERAVNELSEMPADQVLAKAEETADRAVKKESTSKIKAAAQESSVGDLPSPLANLTLPAIPPENMIG